MSVVQPPELVPARVSHSDRGRWKEKPSPACEPAPGPGQINRDSRQRHADHQAIHPERWLLADAEVPGGVVSENVDGPKRQRQGDDRGARREERRPRPPAAHAGRQEQGQRHQEVEPLLDRKTPGNRKELEVPPAEVLEKREAVPVEAPARQRQQDEHEVVGRESTEPSAHVEAAQRLPGAVPQHVLEQDLADEKAAQGEEELYSEKAHGVVGRLQVEPGPGEEEAQAVGKQDQTDGEAAKDVEAEVSR